jgi:hypothetical protein
MRKTDVMSIRCTPELHNVIKHRAIDANCSVAEFVERLVSAQGNLGPEIPPVPAIADVTRMFLDAGGKP